MVPAVHQEVLILLDTKGVVQPEELRWFLRVPVVDDFAGVIELEHRGLPLVHGRHRQQRCDGGLAGGRFSNEQHEPACVERLSGLLVGVGDNDLGEVLAHRFQNGPGLGICAFVENLPKSPRP